MARDKRQRFLALAESRTQHVLEDLRLVANLANKRNYDYTDGEARQIFRAIEKEMEAARTKFADASRDQRKHFRLNT